MNDPLLARKFERMGARLRLVPIDRGEIRLDVGSDGDGTFFDLRVNPRAVTDLQALDVRPAERHLLLLARVRGADGQVQKQKFLCGHDERAWFVAAVPGPSASTVRTAMEALKPRPVRLEQDRKHVRGKDRNRRRNAAFVRQGEWFFMPAPEFRPGPGVVLRDEPLRRGNGKPHVCEFLFRTGGELVYVSPDYPRGLTVGQYRRLVQRRPKLAKLRWTTMRRNPQVYVKGRIRHPDHRTVVLPIWHWVAQNTETLAPAMRHVAFLD